jgi:hypothetical protein
VGEELALPPLGVAAGVGVRLSRGGRHVDLWWPPRGFSRVCLRICVERRFGGVTLSRTRQDRTVIRASLLAPPKRL